MGARGRSGVDVPLMSFMPNGACYTQEIVEFHRALASSQVTRPRSIPDRSSMTEPKSRAPGSTQTNWNDRCKNSFDVDKLGVGGSRKHGDH